MSCTLHWKPIIKDSESISEIHLREILDKKYGYPHHLSYIDIDYIQALVDAGIDGAQDLLDAIRKHDDILIFLEC